MRTRNLLIAVLSGSLLLPMAGCPVISPPPPTDTTPDLGAFVRDALSETNETGDPIEITDNQKFIDSLDDDFADVLSDPAFDVQ